MTERHDFTTEERKALDTFDAPAAPADFADRLLEALADNATGSDEPPKRSRRRRAVEPAVFGSALRWILPAAAVATLAVGASLALIDGPSSGSLVATTRTEANVGDRAVAVAEPGATLRWNVSRSGAADVEQSSGHTFYRVNRGGPFVVRTPLGQVRVLGTCFSVEVRQVNSKKAALMASGATALVTTMVIVSVYEGQVVTASPAGELTMRAGAVATIEPGAAPRTAAAAATPIANPPARAVASADQPADSEADPAAQMLPEATRAALTRLPELKREAEQLRARVQELEAEVGKMKGIDQSRRTYDLSPEELRKMADQCELRWDLPGIWSPKPPTVGREAFEELALSDADRDGMNEALAEFHTTMQSEIRKIYVELTGDDSTGSLSLQAMFAEIEDKTPKAVIKATFRRLARERAGLSPPPANEAGMIAYERLYRLLTTAGHRAESLMADRVGPDVARQVRDHRGGFGGKHRSSYGCPD